MSISTSTLSTSTSNAALPFQTRSIIKTIPADESDVIRNLTLLSETYRPYLLDLITLSLSQSPLSIEEIEKIYFEDVLSLGCRNVRQEDAWRRMQEVEILRGREMRKLMEERRENSRSQGRFFGILSTSSGSFWNAELVKKGLAWKRWIFDFGDIWREDAISNWKVVKYQLTQIHAQGETFIYTTREIQDFYPIISTTRSFTPGEKE